MDTYRSLRCRRREHDNIEAVYLYVCWFQRQIDDIALAKNSKIYLDNRYLVPIDIHIRIFIFELSIMTMIKYDIHFTLNYLKLWPYLTIMLKRQWLINVLTSPSLTNIFHIITAAIIIIYISKFDVKNTLEFKNKLNEVKS